MAIKAVALLFTFEQQSMTFLFFNKIVIVWKFNLPLFLRSNCY